MRESIEEKAGRYLAEGRITILVVDDNRIRATARGSGNQRYRIRYDYGAFREWRCDCSPFTHRCSHIAAVQRISAPGRKVSAGNPKEIST